MAKCRISNLIPPCDYNVQGVVGLQIMDFEDFEGYEFAGDATEDVAMVSALYGVAPVGVPVSSSTRYSSVQGPNRTYTHTVETFVPALSADISAALNLARRRKYVVVFTTANGQRFTYGYEAGAALSYTNQTAEATGAVVSLVANSIHPLFEIEAGANIEAPRIAFDVDFDFGAFCNISYGS